MDRSLIAISALATFLTACPAQTPTTAPDPEPTPAVEAPSPVEKAPTAANAIPERKDDAERNSKNGHLVMKTGDVDIDVRFGRPVMRGRTVWGELVPYGSVWRTGADEAATASFSGDVTVEGEALPAGVYSLFTIPGESEWTIIFNKNAAQWGSFSYDEGMDALRVTVTPETNEAIEAFDIQKTDSGIALRWDTVSVPVSIAAAE